MDGGFVLPAAGSFAQMGSDEVTVQQVAQQAVQLPLTSPLASPRAVSDEMQQQAQPQPPTVPALTTEELDAVKKIVGPTASVLASVISKLYLCPASLGEYRWTGHWGACVLVVDRNPPSSRHIQLYSMHNWERVLSVQLYQDMLYLAPNHLFHTFEIDDALVGLSFGNLDQAHNFLVKVREHIPAHGTVTVAKQEKVKKPGLLARLFGSSSSSNSNGSETSGSPGGSGGGGGGGGSDGGGGSGGGGDGSGGAGGGSDGGGGGGGGGGKGGSGLSISTPTSVVHMAHAGFDSVTGGLAHRDLPPEWHSLFSNAQQALLHSKQQQLAAAAAASGGAGVQASPTSSNRSSPSPYPPCAPSPVVASGGEDGALAPAQSPQHRPSHIWGPSSATSSP